MGYLNPIYITDIHVKEIVENENVNDFYTLTDKAVDAFCQSKGVLTGDIPTDDDGYVTTYAVIEYARYFFYKEVLPAFWGSARGEQDVYYDKAEFYKELLAKCESETTKDRILNDSPLDRSDFMGTVPVY